MTPTGAVDRVGARVRVIALRVLAVAGFTAIAWLGATSTASAAAAGSTTPGVHSAVTDSAAGAPAAGAVSELSPGGAPATSAGAAPAEVAASEAEPPAAASSPTPQASPTTLDLSPTPADQHRVPAALPTQSTVDYQLGTTQLPPQAAVAGPNPPAQTLSYLLAVSDWLKSTADSVVDPADLPVPVPAPGSGPNPGLGLLPDLGPGSGSGGADPAGPPAPGNELPDCGSTPPVDWPQPGGADQDTRGDSPRDNALTPTTASQSDTAAALTSTARGRVAAKQGLVSSATATAQARPDLPDTPRSPLVPHAPQQPAAPGTAIHPGDPFAGARGGVVGALPTHAALWPPVGLTSNPSAEHQPSDSSPGLPTTTPD